MRLPTGVAKMENSSGPNQALRYAGEQLYRPGVATGDADKLFTPDKIRAQSLKNRTVEAEEVLRPFQKTVMIKGIERSAVV